MAWTVAGARSRMNKYEGGAHRRGHKYRVNRWESRKFPQLGKPSQHDQRGNITSTGGVYVLYLPLFIVVT